MKIEALMTREPRTCSPTDSLSAAAGIMWDHDCGCVPVVDSNSRLLGMITDRDVCMAAYTKGEPLHALRVEQTMARSVEPCRPDQSVAEALQIMRRSRVRRLPVVDGDGILLGLLSLTDVAREAGRQSSSRRKTVKPAEVGETLADICQGSRTGTE